MAVMRSGRGAAMAIAAIFMSAILAGAAAGTARAECAEDVATLRGAFGTARFTVEIADDAAERARGLMFVEELPRSAGMLFIYEAVGAPAFWMKNTLIPLDMLFIRPDGVVQHVHDSAVPGDLTPITGGEGVIAVLEINGGLAERLGIEPGAEIRHPAFGAEAAWPCEDAGG